MKQRTNSEKQMPTPYINYSDYMPNPLNYHSRLLFPQNGDSGFFQSVGKKHYQNHSNRLLKIVLPEKYALNNPIPIKQYSISPPHLQRQYSENNKSSHLQISNNARKKFFQLNPPQTKVSDALDKLQIEIQQKKFVCKQNSIILQKENKANKRTIIHNTQPYSPSSNSYSISPLKTQKSQKNEMIFLYNPQNKAKYDKLDEGRSRNPTHLSSGLNII